jgi:hypothetical protein
MRTPVVTVDKCFTREELIKMQTESLLDTTGALKKARFLDEDCTTICRKCCQDITAHRSMVQAQAPAIGGLMLQDTVQGISISMRMFLQDPQRITTSTAAATSIAMFPVPDTIVDTGANFTIILSAEIFDAMARAFQVEPQKCDVRVTGDGVSLANVFPCVWVQLPGLTDSNGKPLCEVMKVYRGASISLFGIQALEIFHLGVSPYKQIFQWTSTSCGYAIQRGPQVQFETNSPLLPTA